MLKGPFLSKDWMGANPSYENSSWVMLGLAYDGTCSNKSGTKFAPQAIRTASFALEEYSPVFDRELCEIDFFDAGDLDLPLGNRDKSLDIIEQNVKSILDDNKKVFSVGGEHLVSLPAIKAYYNNYKDLNVIHFDAHCDLRENYLGEKLSHACVIRRVLDFLPTKNLYQIGIRSGEKSEFELMKINNTLVKNKEDKERMFKNLQNNPVYLTVDIDVLDTSVVPGTGTQETGGMQFNELVGYFKEFKDKGLNIVGMDLVELSPDYDTSGASTAVAVKIVREMLLAFV